MKPNAIKVSTAVVYTSVLLGAALSVRGSCGSISATINGLPSGGNLSYQVNGLNSAGQFTGYFFNDSISGEAFLYNDGNVIDLGTLGGTFSEGRAINNPGWVVGDSINGLGQDHAALYDGHGVIDLGTLGGTGSSAGAINDAGTVIGVSLTVGDATSEAFLYSNGSMISLGTFGGSQSAAFALNNQGLVVGEAANTNGDFRAFSYSTGPIQDLGTLGGTYSAAFAVNDAGVIVGESSVSSGDTHAFVYSGGVMTDLGTFGGSYTSAYLINQSNQAAGLGLTSGGVYHGFFFAFSTLTDLGTLGGQNVYPNGMNDLGQVVGQADTASGGSHAFLWQKGSLVDLNSVLPTNSGWELTSALYINNAGRIVGTGSFNGVDSTFVMDVKLGNSAPTAVAGADQTVECGTQVTLDGTQSSDPDGDTLSYEWTCAGFALGTNSTLSGYFGLGKNVVTLKVSDPCGASAEAAVTVIVKDTTPPQIIAPATMQIVAGLNCNAPVPDFSTNVQGSDNCSAPSTLRFTQQPAPGTLIGLGQHPIYITVADESGNTNVVTVVVEVVDHTAPVIISAPAQTTVAVGNACQGIVPNLVPNVVAIDGCTPANQLVITQNPVAGTAVDKGSHTVVITVTDAAGNHSSTNVTLNAVDQTAPVIHTATVSPNTISPPNHQMVPVTVSVSATDNCDASPVSKITSITCNESVTAGEIVITGPLTASLAATRNGGSGGRVYTLTIRCTDNSGNSSQTTVTVTVPQGNGKK